MKPKLTIRLAGLLLALIAVCLSFGVTHAQDASEKETFEESNPSNWEFSEGTQVADGQLVIQPNNFAARFGDWDELTLAMRVMVTGPGEFALHYAFTDESRYILHFVLDEAWLERVSGDSTSDLAFNPTAGLATGEWVDLEVSFIEGLHLITIDGTTVLEVTDPAPLFGGGLLFQTGGERTATIDEVQITRPGFGLPTEGEPGEAPEPDPLPPPAQETTGQTEPDQDVSPLDDFLSSLLNRGPAQIPLSTFVGNLLLAAIFSFILSRVYIHWGSSLSNRRRFASNFMLIAITTTFIILVVRSSVALSLGLVGALSIVRFRTAIKEPEELAYLFFAIGLGIGLGDNQRMITLVALAVGISLIGLLRLFRRPQADVNLHLSILEPNPQKIELEQIISTVEAFCTKWKLIRYDEGPGNLEAAFLVEFQELAALSRAKQALNELSASIEITFLDNQGME